MLQRVHTVILAALLAHVTASTAHDQPPAVHDRVHLAADAAREVDTDTLVAVVYKEHQSGQQAAAADQVNRDVRWAIDLAKARNIDVETTSYRTQPVYQKQHIQGWRVHQSIRLESPDSAELASLLGDLQQRLSIQLLQNTLSAQAREKAEQALTVEALQAFQARSDLIARTLGRPGHRIVEISVEADGDRAPVVPRVRTLQAAETSRTIAAPATEGGRIRVEVRVAGSIELLPAP